MFLVDLVCAGYQQVDRQRQRGSPAVEKILELLVGHALGGLGEAAPVLGEGHLADLGLWGENLVLQVLWSGYHLEGD